MNDMKDDNSYSNMHEMLKEYLDGVGASAAKFYAVPGISTGFLPLDELTCGFEAGKVYVIGGRPCMGREELMLSMIRNIILETKLPVLLFTTNHQKSDYVSRLLSIHCSIPTLHLHRGNMDFPEWELLDKEVATLADAPLSIHDSLDLPLNELMETARNCIRERGIKIIFIDCLQMIDFNNEDKHSSERIALVMYSLKQLACQSDVPIVVGSMLSRGVEYREGIEGKQPQLQDLANSSYIEGLADVIMMVHRPEYYHIYEDEYGRSLRGQMEIIVKKNGLKPLGSMFFDYRQDMGIVSWEKMNKPASKSGGMDILVRDNGAVESLINNLDLEEEQSEFMSF